MDELMITVKFPDGKREVPAYLKTLMSYIAYGDYTSPTYHQVLTPEPIDGWIFAHHFDGSWSAYRETNW